MNLVLSGPIDDTLRNLVVALSKPRRVVPLHGKADRLEGVDDHDAVRRQVAALCEKARVDHAYVEKGVRFSDFKLLAMDMDSTLITIECIDEIADFAGKKAEVAAITESAMRGEIADFSTSLTRRVMLLAGTSTDVLRRVYDERLRLTAGAEQLLFAAQKTGMKTLLVSGGFTYFAKRLQYNLSLDASFANELEIINGRLTGRVIEPILDSGEKARYLREAMRATECKSREAIVIGDGANDIPMMAEVEYSVAYHAKPITVKTARLAVRYGTLATLLHYFQ